MKNLIIIPLVFLCLVSKAQLNDIEIVWGEPYKSKKTVVTDIISTEGGDIYAIKRNLGLFNQDVYLEKYRNLEPYKSSEITFDKRERADVMKSIINVNNDLWMLEFKSNYDYASLTAQFVDKSTLQTMGERVDIFQFGIERKLRYSYGGFDYSISRNKLKTGFVTQYPGDRDEVATLGLQVRDEYFDLMWERDIDLKHSKEVVELAGFDVSNDGIAYSLIKVFDTKKTNSDKRANKFEYQLIACSAKGEATVIPINIDEGNIIQNIHFEVTDNGDVYIGGFYGASCCTIDGSFFMSIEGTTNKVSKYNIKAFSLDFITEGLSERKQNKLERRFDKGQEIGFNNVDFRDFIIREDGGIVLVGEFYDISLNNRSEANTGNPNSTHFNYKDIVVVNISADGQIEWSKKILKRQLTTDDGGFMSSFVLAVNGDNLHFIFNDHEANINAQTEKDLATYSRSKSTSVVTLVSLNAQGDMTRETIISQKELGLEIRPQSCEQVSANELILFGLKKNENQFARVLFN